jgi:hypothetical protein
MLYLSRGIVHPLTNIQYTPSKCRGNCTETIIAHVRKEDVVLVGKTRVGGSDLADDAVGSCARRAFCVSVL